MARRSKFQAPRVVEDFDTVQRALRQVQEALDDATGLRAQLKLNTRNFALTAGNFQRVSAPAAGLQARLPAASGENLSEPVIIHLENMLGELVVFAAPGQTVNGAATATFDTDGVIVLWSNGVSSWSGVAQLPSESPAAPNVDAEYLLGSVSADLPNAAVGTDTTYIDFAYTPGGFATWTLNLAALLADIDSTSIVVSGSTLQRAAVTGAISIAQNANTSTFSGLGNGLTGNGTGTATLAARWVDNASVLLGTGYEFRGEDSATIEEAWSVIGSQLSMGYVIKPASITPASLAYGVQALTGAGPHNDVVLLPTTTVITYDSDCSITGFSGGTNGRQIAISAAIGGSTLTLPFNSALSTAGNRIATPDGADYVQARGGALICFDTSPATDIWRVVATAAPTDRISNGVNTASVRATGGVALASGFAAVTPAAGDIVLNATSGVGIFAGHATAEAALSSDDISVGALSGLALTAGVAPITNVAAGVLIESGAGLRVVTAATERLEITSTGGWQLEGDAPGSDGVMVGHTTTTPTWVDVGSDETIASTTEGLGGPGVLSAISRDEMLRWLVANRGQTTVFETDFQGNFAACGQQFFTARDNIVGTSVVGVSLDTTSTVSQEYLGAVNLGVSMGAVPAKSAWVLGANESARNFNWGSFRYLCAIVRLNTTATTVATGFQVGLVGPFDTYGAGTLGLAGTSIGAYWEYRTDNAAGLWVAGFRASSSTSSTSSALTATLTSRYVLEIFRTVAGVTYWYINGTHVKTDNTGFAPAATCNLYFTFGAATNTGTRNWGIDLVKVVSVTPNNRWT